MHSFSFFSPPDLFHLHNRLRVAMLRFLLDFPAFFRRFGTFFRFPLFLQELSADRRVFLWIFIFIRPLTNAVK